MSSAAAIRTSRRGQTFLRSALLGFVAVFLAGVLAIGSPPPPASADQGTLSATQNANGSVYYGQTPRYNNQTRNIMAGSYQSYTNTGQLYQFQIRFWNAGQGQAMTNWMGFNQSTTTWRNFRSAANGGTVISGGMFLTESFIQTSGCPVGGCGNQRWAINFRWNLFHPY